MSFCPVRWERWEFFHNIPVVTMLNGGVLSYFVGQKQSYLAVQGGYAQVDNNRVTVLVERAAFAEEIDVVVAEQDEKKRQSTSNNY